MRAILSRILLAISEISLSWSIKVFRAPVKRPQSIQDQRQGQPEGMAVWRERMRFESRSKAYTNPDVGMKCGKPVAQGYRCNMPQGHENQCIHVGQIHPLLTDEEFGEDLE